jgi:hypothetical protein
MRQIKIPRSNAPLPRPRLFNSFDSPPEMELRPAHWAPGRVTFY